jgi:tetratricopeptide (TPR) repeat protein
MVGAVSCTSQDKQNYCRNSNRKSLEKICSLPIFNETNFVMIGSFKASSVPLKDGQVDISRFFEVKRVDEKDKDELFKILVNYDYSPSATNIKSTAYFCYDPRNAILFVNKRGQIIGYVEICFECNGYKVMPRNLEIGRFCDEKFNALKEQFAKSGIDYGIRKINEVSATLDSINILIEKDPNNAGLYSSRAGLQIGQEKYKEALNDLNRSLTLDSTWRNHTRYFLRGHSKFKLNDFSGAIKDFDMVIKFQKNAAPEAYLERALSNIKIYSQNSEVFPIQIKDKICKDLQVAKQGGTNVDTELLRKYCDH